MKHLLYISLFALFMGCSDGSTPVEQSDDAKNNMIESGAYTIRSDEKKSDIVRKVHVDLDERVTKQQLEKIANEIKESDKNNYERTLIMYRIKDEKSVAAWATTNFDPDLEINFIGLDADKYNTLLKMARHVEGEKVGEWYNTSGYDHIVVIYKKDGQYFENSYFEDTNTTPKPRKLKFENGKYSYADSDENWHFLVNDAGDLEYWGESGNSTTAKKV